ncbi:glycosyltransferase family 10 domain-containing protein [Salinimonas sediminis]|uniref:Fucosyltransferase C-terminal domain-containing protein n=1 Tax=Salinimonas sediminis TaxID=2303538 RepID=A0A346NQN8_9ALTE|nr:glycosyltransferase family 10 [Salinimonas sediminis]AXR07845.1 hypothetical protein D0Y50_16665 [Salinimonas sediminis]
MFNIYLYGRYKKRVPFSYSAYENLLGKRFLIVNEAKFSDFIIVSNYKDVEQNQEFFSRTTKKNPNLKIVLFSEEPFWDTLSNYNTEEFFFTVDNGPLAGTKIFNINHQNCDVFDFNYIPYFLTTEASYITRYIFLLTNLLKLTPKMLLNHWDNADYQLGSLSEKRLGAHFDLYNSQKELIGLSRFRSTLAESYTGKKLVHGLGWSPTPRRQKLPDWHSDKISKYLNKSRYLSSIENTHLSNYMTEKLFDSFAVRSFPIYYSSPDHRIKDLISENSYLNLYGYDTHQSVKLIEKHTLSLINADSYLNDADRMLNLFTDCDYITDERFRFIDKVYRKFKKISEHR